MAALIYTLCAVTSGLCALMLWRAHAANGARLLFWSACSFLLLTLNNLVLVLDKLALPDQDGAAGLGARGGAAAGRRPRVGGGLRCRTSSPARSRSAGSSRRCSS